jgi:GNAT superfamily N-acetyltransferase
MSAARGQAVIRRSRAIAADLRCIARADGWRASALRLLGWIAYTIFRREDRFVLAKRLTGTAPAGDAAGRVRVERAEPRHLPALAEFNRRHCNARAMRRHGQVRRDREAMLAFVGDELVGYLWCMEPRSAWDDIDVLRLGPEVAEDDVYAFEMFVAPERRGDGNASAFVIGACERLAQLGYRRVWGFVDHDNVPARWLYSTNGWTTVRRSRSWHLLSRLAVIDGTPYVVAGGGATRLRAPLARRRAGHSSLRSTFPVEVLGRLSRAWKRSGTM